MSVYLLGVFTPQSEKSQCPKYISDRIDRQLTLKQITFPVLQKSILLFCHHEICVQRHSHNHADDVWKMEHVPSASKTWSKRNIVVSGGSRLLVSERWKYRTFRTFHVWSWTWRYRSVKVCPIINQCGARNHHCVVNIYCVVKLVSRNMFCVIVYEMHPVFGNITPSPIRPHAEHLDKIGKSMW